MVGLTQNERRLKMFKFFAWVVMVTIVLKLLITPYYAGQKKEKGHFDISDIIATIVEATILVPLCLRVLEII